MYIFLLPLYTAASREKVPSYKGTNPTHEGFTFMISLAPNPTFSLGVRISTYKFGGKQTFSP
jgi:hypothetical protein